MVVAEPAGDVQPASRRAGRLFEQLERLGQDVQSLLRTDAGEVADGEGPLPFGARPAVAGEVQAGMDDVDALARNAEIVGHEVGVVGGGGDEAVDLAAVLADQRQATAAVRLRQRFEKDVVALQRAQHRHAQPCASISWTMPESSALVRLTISGLTSSASQSTSLSTSLRLMAVLALEHGDGQVAEIRGLAS